MIPTQGDIAALEGRTVCAVVYDSEIRVDAAGGFGNLKGATLGLTAFRVTAVGPVSGGPELPAITVGLLATTAVQTVCGLVSQ